MIEITINKADAVASQLETLVCGMVNMVEIHFTLSEHWDGLLKTAVFTNGQTTIDVLESAWLTPDICVLPPEMVAVPGKKVSVGLRGQATIGTDVGILPSTLCALGTVKPGPAAQADSGVQPSLPVWGQLQEQVTKLKESTKMCYTTLERPKAKEDSTDATIRINLHGVSQLTGALSLHVYVCQRRRMKSHYWRHPDNWDTPLDKGVVKMGYGMIAGKSFANGDIELSEKYPAVPDWMLHDGYLQTVLPISRMALTRNRVGLDLSSWLLPLLKPSDNDGFAWTDCGLMGIQGDGSIAPLLFRFYLAVDGKVVGTTQNTLAVGIRRELSEDDHILTADNLVNSSVLYISIR